MKIETISRKQEVARLRRLVERAHSPRLHMFLIVSLTAAIGFIASFLLLHVGMNRMWLRYPAAVLVAYMGFLFLLWVWLRLRESEVFDALDIPYSGDGPSPHIPSFNGGGGHFGGGGHSGSFQSPSGIDLSSSVSASDGSGTDSVVSDIAGDLDIGELAIVIVAILALIGSVWAALTIITAAPTLFAELLLDGALATGLYKRLRNVDGDHWLTTAVRRTAWRFVGVAVLFSLIGVVMQIVVPGAKSIGQVIQ
jgi:hypothetical protein